MVGHKWADISQPNYGVAILNDCKYGHRIHGNVISLNLLRSPGRPDPEADQHTHRFRYALYPHAGNHVAANVVRRAWEFNVPVRVVQASGAGRLPPTHRFVSIDSESVIIDTIKKAEDDNDLILRLYESHGIDCPARLEFAENIDRAHEVDLLEENGTAITVRNNAVRLNFSPFEIKTLKLPASSL